MKDRVAVGEIRKAHGIRGGMWVKPLTDSPDRARGLNEVFLMRDGEERVARVQSVEVAENRWIFRLEGVETREQAEMLHGWLIGIAATDSPPLPEGSFYVSELVGREVRTEDGRLLGTLTGVSPTGSNDVYTISGPDGELLFPALKDLVMECPRGGNTMKVRLLPGLLEACTAKRG